MKRHIYYMAIMATLLGSCSSKTGQQGEAVAKDTLSAVADTTTSVAMEDSAELRTLAAEVERRVAAMYDDVFDHFNREDFASWDYEKYFSDSLLALWKSLPDDELVLDMNPWTWSQDYDTLAYTRIDVDLKSKDMARATIILALWPGYDSSVTIDLVRQQRSLQDGATWLVNDFREGSHPDWPSVAEQIKDYLKEAAHRKDI